MAALASTITQRLGSPSDVRSYSTTSPRGQTTCWSCRVQARTMSNAICGCVRTTTAPCVVQARHPGQHDQRRRHDLRREPEHQPPARLRRAHAAQEHPGQARAPGAPTAWRAWPRCRARRPPPSVRARVALVDRRAPAKTTIAARRSVVESRSFRPITQHTGSTTSGCSAKSATAAAALRTPTPRRSEQRVEQRDVQRGARRGSRRGTRPAPCRRASGRARATAPSACAGTPIDVVRSSATSLCPNGSMTKGLCTTKDGSSTIVNGRAVTPRNVASVTSEDDAEAPVRGGAHGAATSLTSSRRNGRMVGDSVSGVLQPR